MDLKLAGSTNFKLQIESNRAVTWVPSTFSASEIPINVKLTC